MPELGLDKDTAGCTVYEKKLFSMCTPDFARAFNNERTPNVILCGIEVSCGPDLARVLRALTRARAQTHVCVLQTALALRRQNVNVYICTDGVSSQRPIDRSTALQVRPPCRLPVRRPTAPAGSVQRLTREGAVLTTSESILFEILETAVRRAARQPCRSRVRH